MRICESVYTRFTGGGSAHRFDSGFPSERAHQRICKVAAEAGGRGRPETNGCKRHEPSFLAVY